MLEQLIVYLIVAIALLACVWHLAPVTWRLWLARSVRSRCEVAGARPSVLGPALVRAASAPSGNCAGCGARGQCPVGKSLSRR